MKNTMIILFATLIIGALTLGCKKDDPEFQTKDFVATFFTNLVSIGEDSVSCAPPRTFLNVQEGSGSEATVGNFDTRMTFCVDVTTFEYGDTDAVMTAENGDKLYLDVSGQIFPTTKPAYDLEFKDPFTIIGGTGKFENATGSGMTESYVNQTTGRTDHVWTGTITLKN
jgi:hypothetical protein